MSDSWLSFLSYLFAVVIGKRLRSPEKDAVVAQVFRDGFFTEYAYSRRICRLKIFSGKCPAGAGGRGLLLYYQFLENSLRYCL